MNDKTKNCLSLSLSLSCVYAFLKETRRETDPGGGEHQAGPFVVDEASPCARLKTKKKNRTTREAF
jgi:hypothetical protein